MLRRASAIQVKVRSSYQEMKIVSTWETMPVTPQAIRSAPVMCGKIAIVVAFLNREARERFHVYDLSVQLLHCPTLDLFRLFTVVHEKQFTLIPSA